MCVLCVCGVCVVCASSASAHVSVHVVCVVHARVRVRVCACVMGGWAGMMGAGRYRSSMSAGHVGIMKALGGKCEGIQEKMGSRTVPIY